MYLVIDNETGGIGPEYSLLTTYLAVLDKDFNIIREMDLLLKPDNGIYRICGEAMRVNKINLTEHDEKAKTYSSLGKGVTSLSNLYLFLSDSFEANNKQKLIPIGHNVKGDIEGVCRHLISPGSWDAFVSYRLLDTSTIARFLILAGKIPGTVSGSLVSLSKHFGIDTETQHTSRGDCEMTIAILRKMLDLVRHP